MSTTKNNLHVGLTAECAILN